MNLTKLTIRAAILVMRFQISITNGRRSQLFEGHVLVDFIAIGTGVGSQIKRTGKLRGRGRTSRQAESYGYDRHQTGRQVDLQTWQRLSADRQTGQVYRKTKRD